MSIDSRKLRILTKLVASGADTEKKITGLDFQDIVKIGKDQKIVMADMEIILELQNAIKNRNAIGYLTGGKDEKEGGRHGASRDKKGQLAGRDIPDGSGEPRRA